MPTSPENAGLAHISTDMLLRMSRFVRKILYAPFAMRCTSIPISASLYAIIVGTHSKYHTTGWLCVNTYSVSLVCLRGLTRVIHPPHSLRNVRCAERPSSLSQGRWKSSMCSLQNFVQSRGCHHSLWIHPLQIHFTSIQSEHVQNGWL